MDVDGLFDIGVIQKLVEERLERVMNVAFFHEFAAIDIHGLFSNGKMLYALWLVYVNCQ